MSYLKLLRDYLGRKYLRANISVWRSLPASASSSGPARVYGRYLHGLVQSRVARVQRPGTFFFRNRPELELLIHLLDQKVRGSALDMTILACSKGAEVYSISYGIRCARPDLNFRLRAVDIDRDILEFAKGGIYFVGGRNASGSDSQLEGDDVAMNTSKEQATSIFERTAAGEMEALFDRDGDRVSVKPQFREGITWQLGDAGDPGLLDELGPQDIVVANRFLCHMQSVQAERCLRNLAGLVKPGGYLFVSGVDLSVRSKVAQELGWKPVTELIREIHDGDPSLRRDWPLDYWGLEPFDGDRIDWKTRYASVFQLGVAAQADQHSANDRAVPSASL